MRVRLELLHIGGALYESGAIHVGMSKGTICRGMAELPTGSVQGEGGRSVTSYFAGVAVRVRHLLRASSASLVQVVTLEGVLASSLVVPALVPRDDGRDGGDPPAVAEWQKPSGQR